MARPKGSKNREVKVIEPVKEAEIIETPEEKPAVKDNSGLEDRPYFSVDEAARFLGVEEACARLWFDHGHLKGINDLGFIRVSRASILGCRFRKLTSGPMM